jgi:hypothetical protein
MKMSTTEEKLRLRILEMKDIVCGIDPKHVTDDQIVEMNSATGDIVALSDMIANEKQRQKDREKLMKLFDHVQLKREEK